LTDNPDNASDTSIVRLIGEGLLGEVYEAVDKDGNPVAVKRLTHAVPSDDEKFKREFEILSRLDHPNLTRYREYRTSGPPVEVTESFVEALPFLEYLRRPPTQDEVETLIVREEESESDLIEEDDFGEVDTGEMPDEGAEADRDDAENEVQPDADDADDAESDETTEVPEGTEAPDEGAVDAEESTASVDEPDASDVDVEAPAETAEHTAEVDESDEAEAPDGDFEQDETLEEGESDREDADEPRSTETLELTELVEVTTDELGELAPSEAAAEIVERLADESSLEHSSLDLLLLRLERVLPQVIAALDHLHRFKKAHGDLRPSNILVSSDDSAYLTDYGLARWLEMVEDDDVEGLSAPSEEARREKANYDAPETEGFGDATQQGDLYSLGAVLYEAIGGRPPFEGAPDDIREAKKSRAPESLSELEPQCPASWVDLIHGLLDRNPDKRPSLEEVRNLVERSESYAVDIPPTAVPEQEYFLGRSTLVEEVTDTAKRCSQERTMTLAMLRGPYGVGKTAVSEAIAYLASQRGWLVVRGKSYNRESLIYQGWDEIAAQLADICKHLPEEMQEKTRACRQQASALFPVLRFEDEEFELKVLDRLDAVASFRTLLKRISLQRPLLILMDDLHWSSPDTAALLLDLMGDPRGLRCLVLGTWLAEESDDDDHPLVDGFATAPTRVEWHDVTGFSKSEAREYVLSAGAHLSLEAQRSILKEGNLNPLLLEELIHGIEADDEAASAFSRELEEISEASEERIRDRLTKVFESRIEALNRREHFALQVLSVASIPLPDAIISVMVDDEFHGSTSGHHSSREIIENLLEKRFIRPVESHLWERSYTLTHNLYRRLVLEDLRSQRYSHLCSRIAEGIRLVWPSAEELRFEYLVRAGQTRDAIDSATRAADSAETRYAYHRAASMWQWLNEQPESQSLGDVSPRREVARLTHLASHFERAAPLFGDVAEQASERHERVELRMREFDSCVRISRGEDAVAALEDALDQYGDHYLRRTLWTRLSEAKNRAFAATTRWSNPLDGAQRDVATPEQKQLVSIYASILDTQDILDSTKSPRFQAKLSLVAEESDDAELLGIDRLYLARTNQYHGVWSHKTRVERWYDEADKLLERGESWAWRARAALARCGFCRMLGRFEEANEHHSRSLRFFRRANTRRLPDRYRVEFQRGLLKLARGDFEGAEFSARQMLHFYRRDRLVEFRANEILIPMYLLRGMWGVAEHHIDRCEELLSDAPVNLASVWLGRQSTFLNIALGRPEVATGQLDVLLDRLHESGLNDHPHARVLAHISMAQALCARAERERVLAHARPHSTLSRLKKSVRIISSRSNEVGARLSAEIHRLAARQESLRGNPRRALRELDEATDALSRYLSPIDLAKTLEARGLLLQNMGESDATRQIRQAREVYDQFGAKFPLILEGWPVPREFSALGEDTGE
jgi:serine/threonine protein kinase/tetratricopeptide (TPR) repeat protein